MKTIFTFLAIIFIPAMLSSQSSSITIGAGAEINVGTNADICADDIINNGILSGSGTKCTGPLPVELASFSSNISGRNIRLNWETSFEQNNLGFDVERKMVGADEWRKITFVSGKGNSSSPVQYSYEDMKLNSGKYNYRLKQIDYNGNFKYYELNRAAEIGVPKIFSLSQNYPNPFNPVTKIDYELPVDSKVTLVIYDVTGRQVAKLLNNEFRSAGYYTAEYNAANFASGVYFYRLQSAEYTEIKRMILTK
ncbi:MAG: T9SS type A sorting domain-containing protein [Ignavibacteriae bacterium]|nr:T9SS type A sorting domain-containing protein [Ignavibacteriota bacterium]